MLCAGGGTLCGGGAGCEALSEVKPNMALQSLALESGDHPAAPELMWEVHRARGRVGQAVVVIAAALAAGAVCMALFRSLPFALFSVVAVLGATAEFLFPIRYRLNAEGAELRNLHNWRRMGWEEVKKVYVGEREIKLSPLTRPGRRENFRGVLLLCPENQEAVLALISHYRSLDASPSPSLIEPTSDAASRDGVESQPPSGGGA